MHFTKSLLPWLSPLGVITFCGLIAVYEICNLLSVEVITHTVYLREICDDKVTRCVILEVLIDLLLSNHLPLLQQMTKDNCTHLN